MIHFLSAFLIMWLGVLGAVSARADTVTERSIRGQSLYAAHCLICHQLSGLGTPGVFPPLAQSDVLLQKPDTAIRAVVAGLNQPITVNGKKYNNAMPAVVLTDEQVSDVLTYARNAWGNKAAEILPAQVKTLRAKTEFPTYEALVAANAFAPLPPAPAGFKLREAARLPKHCARLASDGKGKFLYVLGTEGDVWKVDLASGVLQQVFWARNYLNPAHGGGNTAGITLARDGRLYIVANQQDMKGAIATNYVTIYRSAKTENAEPSDLQPWFETAYPWGVGPFNHGVANIAMGPDGFIYVGSGSRTDGNEPGTNPKFSTMGEHPETACMWRFDAKSEHPRLEIFARGFRNPFGFCWNDQGEMFATENGPDANAPEELNHVERDHHYGFPYQFSNWTRKPYDYTPDIPKGLKITQPVANDGPSAGGSAGAPLYTFDPHSCPGGITYLCNDFPEPYRGTYFIVRFGNLLKTPGDVGFDLLQARIKTGGDGLLHAEIKTLLAPLARPLDIHQGAPGKLYILEYTRPLTFAGGMGFPGRILELSAE